MLLNGEKVENINTKFQMIGCTCSSGLEDFDRLKCSNSSDVFSVGPRFKTSQLVRNSRASGGEEVRTPIPREINPAGRTAKGKAFSLTLMALIFVHFQALTAATVTLAWNPSTDPTVAGYNIYYGGAHGVYTNEVTVGAATSATLSGLVPGTTYYIAATTYSAAGLESSLSSELVYLVPTSINQPPTLNVISDLTISTSAGLQTVSLSNITSGATTENQTLTVTAASSDTDLIPNPSVHYTSGSTTGSLSFTPSPTACGTVMVTVTVNDGQSVNNTTTRTFVVNVLPGVSQSQLINPLTNLTTVLGQTVTFSTTAIKQTPPLGGLLTYQWKFNGTNLASAVGSALTLSNVTSNQSGVYSVTVSNGKTTTCETAALTVYATAAPALAPAVHASGQYALAVAGVPGYKYVVEASTNLVNWVPVQTNMAPFTYVDANAGKFRQRFYRSIYAP